MAIVDELSALRTSTLAAIEQAADTSALEEVRVAVLGKAGTLTGYLRGMGQVAKEERAAVGKAVNEVRGAVETALEERKRVGEWNRAGNFGGRERAVKERLARERPPEARRARKEPEHRKLKCAAGKRPTHVVEPLHSAFSLR